MELQGKFKHAKCKEFKVRIQLSIVECPSLSSFHLVETPDLDSTNEGL